MLRVQTVDDFSGVEVEVHNLLLSEPENDISLEQRS